MNANLSSDQFGASPAPAGLTEPRPAASSSRPLALSAQTAGSINRAAAWTKPTNHVLPYSTGTRGSLFTPNAD